MMEALNRQIYEPRIGNSSNSTVRKHAGCFGCLSPSCQPQISPGALSIRAGKTPLQQPRRCRTKVFRAVQSMML